MGLISSQASASIVRVDRSHIGGTLLDGSIINTAAMRHDPASRTVDDILTMYRIKEGIL
jgi:hypothetical protein